MKSKNIKSIRNIVLATTVFYGISSYAASAEGVLNLFAWGDIIPAEMLEKFEKDYNIKVIVTEYDSSDTALAKAQTGGNGFDAAIISSTYVPIWQEVGLLLETDPYKMENYKYMKDEWKKVPYDLDAKYSVPYEIGVTGIGVNREYYKGDINTSAIFLEPPEELIGKINIVPEQDDIMYLALAYVGAPPCSTDKEDLRKLRDVLVKAREYWNSIDYGTVDALAKGDYMATVRWDGDVRRSTALNPSIEFGFPKEGFPVWIDAYVVMNTGKNIENAKIFQNFLMEPEVAAMMTTFTGYANSINGSEEFLADDVKPIADLHIPEDLRKNMKFAIVCPIEARNYYQTIWTSIQK